MDEKIRYWLDIAEYDLTKAEIMLKTGRYLYDKKIRTCACGLVRYGVFA